MFMFYRLPSIARKIIASMNLLGKMSRTMRLCVCVIFYVHWNDFDVVYFSLKTLLLKMKSTANHIEYDRLVKCLPLCREVLFSEKYAAC